MKDFVKLIKYSKVCLIKVCFLNPLYVNQSDTSTGVL